MPDTTDTPNAAGPYAPPPVPGAVPPQQNPWSSGVPAVSGGAAAAAHQPWAAERHTYTFQRVTPGKGPGKNVVSDFRSGEFTMTPDGIQVNGKAVLPQTTRTLVIVGGLLIGIGVLLVALVVEYALRQPRTDTVPWNLVERILLEPAKNRVCIVYRNPAKPAAVPQALSFKLDPAQYQDFTAVASRFAEGRTAPGKILPPTPWWVFLIIFGLIFGIPLLIALLGSN
jgi:hypothetical protein